MRTALVAAILLLAGCLTPTAPLPEESADAVPDTQPPHLEWSLECFRDWDEGPWDAAATWFWCELEATGSYDDGSGLDLISFRAFEVDIHLTGTMFEDGAFKTGLFRPAGDGLYLVEVSARDRAGNVATDSRIVPVDLRMPLPDPYCSDCDPEFSAHVPEDQSPDACGPPEPPLGVSPLGNPYYGAWKRGWEASPTSPGFIHNGTAQLVAHLGDGMSGSWCLGDEPIGTMGQIATATVPIQPRHDRDWFTLHVYSYDAEELTGVIEVRHLPAG